MEILSLLKIKRIPARVLSILVIIALLMFQLNPLQAFALPEDEFAGGDGTLGDPYQITNWEQLNNVRNYLGPGNEDKNFLLMNNLDSETAGYDEYAGTGANGGKGWLPIGTGGSGAAATHFSGTFDGNGKTVQDLFINDTDTAFIGLFGTVNWNAEIKNVRLKDVDVTGGSNVGGLAGFNWGAITGSSAAGNVTGAVSVGGLAGHCEYGSIVNSYSICTVTGNKEYSWAIGGLTGYLDANNGVIEDSFSLGSVSGAEYTGGLVGYSGGVIADSYAACTVACGDVNTAGGLIGDYNDEYGSISNSYYDNQVSGQTDTGKGTPKTTEEMKNGDTFDGEWDFAAIWTIVSEDDKASYPYLQWMEDMESWDITQAPGYTLPAPVTPQGDGTSSSPYLISIPGNLTWMSAQSSGSSGFNGVYFKQTSDINMTAAIDFVPIGDGGNPFKGTYDGSDFKISNLAINSDLQYVGLFASIGSAGTVKDLELEDAVIRSSYAATGADYLMIGGIAGENLGTIQDCHVTESDHGESSISSINGKHAFVGGIAGNNNNYSGVISTCSNSSDVSAGGGAAGGMYAVGGLAGYNLGTIDNCMNRGSVSTADSNAALIYVGGIAGNHAGGAVEYCINLGAVTLSGSSEQKGGIVGFTTASFSAATITNNFYLEGLAQEGIAMVGFDPGTSDGAVSKTDAQLKDSTTFAGWDTDKWTFDVGNYPALKGLRVDSGEEEEPGNVGGGGGSNNKSDEIDISFNGQTQKLAASVTKKSLDDGRTNRVVVLNSQKTADLINSGQTGSKITVPISGTASDLVTGVLTGELIKAMENKQTVLEIRTNTASYTLPAQQLSIDEIAWQLGQDVKLTDVKISIEIGNPPDETVKIIENKASEGSYSIVVPPIEFSVKASFGSNSIEISRFNAYVDRSVAIPDGVDPEKITTAVITDPDGTVRHVPTKVIVIDGKYYAQINSLTNSVYSVIWNPVEFTDTAKHWAKDAINDMGSRMVVSGDGKGNFAPNRDITRAEFSAILVKALGLQANDHDKNPFADVKETSWYSASVCAAYEYGIISGYENNMFKPQDKITREQAMTMISRAMTITRLKTAEEISDADTGRELAPYSDAVKISKYAKSGVAACIQSGVVNGKSANTVAPKANITRAEVAVIIKRLLEKSDLI